MDELQPDIEQLIAVLELLDGTDFSEFRFETDKIKIVIRRGDDAVERAQAAEEPPGVEPPSSPEPPVTAELLDGTIPVKAPLVGTFYRAPQPGAEPFVEVGDRVEPSSVVGIIEVMKLMHAIEAGVAGVVSEFCVANGEAVEYDQVLLKVRPEGGE
jgi:acetyl-CoA carboxylase biotin carboxyl carrier protein